jgi:hypothetical protein
MMPAQTRNITKSTTAANITIRVDLPTVDHQDDLRQNFFL